VEAAAVEAVAGNRSEDRATYTVPAPTRRTSGRNVDGGGGGGGGGVVVGGGGGVLTALQIRLLYNSSS